MSGPVTLTTDFGLGDPTVAIMKGVMLSIKPDLKIIDVTHEIPPQDITRAALCISRFRDYFPEGAIHVAVVDPGVGSNRDAVIVKTGRYFYIGPNNGLFSVLDSDVEKIVKIENPDYLMASISVTFHGRDIFAPVAAHLASKVPMEEFGNSVEKLEKIDLPYPVLNNSGELLGEITYFDNFGNAFTSITDEHLRMAEKKNKNGTIVIRVGDHTARSLSYYYQAASAGELGAIINSFGFMELFSPNANARDMFRLKTGDKLSVRFES